MIINNIEEKINVVEPVKTEADFAKEYIDSAFIELKPVIENFFTNYQGELEIVGDVKEIVLDNETGVKVIPTFKSTLPIPATFNESVEFTFINNEKVEANYISKTINEKGITNIKNSFLFSFTFDDKQEIVGKCFADYNTVSEAHGIIKGLEMILNYFKKPSLS